MSYPCGLKAVRPTGGHGALRAQSITEYEAVAVATQATNQRPKTQGPPKARVVQRASPLSEIIPPNAKRKRRGVDELPQLPLPFRLRLPLPLPARPSAARRRGGPGGGRRTPGLAPGPRPLGPIYEKNRSEALRPSFV
jgi:hypothetical protein